MIGVKVQGRPPQWSMAV